MSPVESAASKVALAAAAVAVVLYRSRKVPRAELGLAPPDFWAAVPIVFIYLGWMLGTDVLIHWRGPWDFRPWQAAPVAASAMRVLAVCFLGPIAEELIFRGWLYAILNKRIGAIATIGITAVGWAALHYSYTPLVIGVIVVDGLLLGLARWRTGSVYVPIAMHVLYNLYAVW